MKRRAPLLPSVAMQIIQQLGGRLWSKQREILNAVFGSSRKRTVVVKSCTGAGKSHVAAYIAWAWLLSGHGRLVVTTAPSQRQVNGAVWNEMRIIARRMEKAGVPIGGSLAPKAATYEGPHGRRAIGYSTDSATNFAGWHSPGGTLVIIDDAQGLDEEAWSTILGTVTGENDRILAIANPLSPSGTFYALCTTVGGDTVERITISAFDTPNLKTGRAVIDGMVTKEQVESIRAIAGEGSPSWKARVLGEFPDTDDMALVPLSWLAAAHDRWKEWAATLELEIPESTSMAADLAGLGVDCGITAVVRDYLFRDRIGAPQRARVLAPLIRHPKFPVENTMGTTGLLKRQWSDIRPDSFRIDKVALGQGIYDRLVEIGVPVIGMSGGTVANDPARYVNQRAEILHAFRDALRPRATDGSPDTRPLVMLPWDERLVHQATTLRMSYTSRGLSKVESKIEWSARQRKAQHAASNSPDELDAVSMAMCPEPAGAASSGIGDFLRAYGSER